jgi:RNA polymerase sigma-70 factor (ECF subfamily)
MQAEMSSNEASEDAELVRRCREGDPEAFRTLVARHHPRIFNLIHGLVRDRDEADDLAQEVFIKAFRSLSGFKGQAQVYTWLYRIAVNRCLDWLKSRRRHPESSLDRVEVYRADGVVLRGSGATDAELERRELGRALEGALRELPPDYRVALTLREVDGLSYEEVADAMGCSVGTVKSRLFRARAQLQRMLAGIHEDWKGA